MFRVIAFAWLFTVTSLLWGQDQAPERIKPPPGGFQELPKELQKKLDEETKTANSGASMSELMSFVRAITIGLCILLGIIAGGQLAMLIFARKTFDDAPVSARIFGLTIVILLACLMPAIGFSGE